MVLSQTKHGSIWLQTTEHSICTEKQQSDVDIYSAFSVVSVDWGEGVYPCEAASMSAFFDTFYTDIWSI